MEAASPSATLTGDPNGDPGYHEEQDEIREMFDYPRDDFTAVLRRLGASIETVRSAETVRGKTAKVYLPAVYDRNLAKLAFETYKEDFEAFGYEQDSWMFQ